MTSGHAFLAFDRRTGIVSAEDVSHRRSRWDRHCWPDVRCPCTEVPLYSYERANNPRCSCSSCSNFMRQQAMASRMSFNRPVPVNQLVGAVAESTSIPPLPCKPDSSTDEIYLSVHQRRRSTHKNTGVVPTAWAFSSSARTRLGLTCTNSHRRGTRMNTTRCRSAHGVRAPRRISRSTMRNSQNVSLTTYLPP